MAEDIKSLKVNNEFHNEDNGTLEITTRTYVSMVEKENEGDLTS